MSVQTPIGNLFILTTGQAAREAVLQARRMGRTVGLVPTMGALHEGHFSLIRASKQSCDVTAVSIFVNPTQFGPQEDLDRYPRTLEADRQALRQLGVDLLFLPSVDQMYPAGFSTFVQPPRVADRWEGQFRPGHFRGVATVVLKLFQLLPADRAFFGEKDFQQLAVVRAMVADLNCPLEITACPTVREADGLAVSSRNVYLDTRQRQQAVALYQSLRVAKGLFQQGRNDAAEILQAMRATLAEAGIDRIDYVALVDPATLEPVTTAWPDTRALVAAHVGATRLIDNERIG